MTGVNQQATLKLHSMGCLVLVLIAAAPGFGQTPTIPFEVSGVVLDPSGAVIAEAKVILRHEGGRSEQTKATNQKGQFLFTRLTSGNYEIEAQKEGFKPTITQLRVGAKPVTSLQIVLPIAEVREEMAV